MQMIYALVHYPKIDSVRIEPFRKKYDPQVGLIKPHITLMFPVSEAVGEVSLIHHLESILRNWQPFLIHLQGIQISSDDHVFLLIREGSANITRLHDEIYTGILADHLREDIPFVPHVTLGVLEKDPMIRERVIEEADQLGIDDRTVLDKLHLVKVNNDRSKIVWNKEFVLKKLNFKTGAD
jgi:2'-5' RNA ligase